MQGPSHTPPTAIPPAIPPLIPLPDHTRYGTGLPGTPVVLLHGFPLDRRVFEGVAVELARHRPVVNVDLPGFGRSTIDHDFTLADLARGVEALTRQLGLKKFAIAGLSMGGYVTLAYHRLFPETLAAVVLVDTKASADTPEARTNRDRMADIARQEGSETIAKLMYPKMLSPGTVERAPQLGDTLMGIMKSCPAQTIARACIAMRDRPDHTPDLAAMAAPLLMITGEDDAITPVDVGQAVATAARDGTFVKITSAGHMAPLEQPAAVAAAVQAFLSARQL